MQVVQFQYAEKYATGKPAKNVKYYDSQVHMLENYVLKYYFLCECRRRAEAAALLAFGTVKSNRSGIMSNCVALGAQVFSYS